MKRKTRIQRSLASLSPADREQLADWLRKETYHAVLQRVTKPREQGGFGLKISIRPLQVYCEKVMILDSVNARLPHDQKLSMADFEAVNAGAVPVRANTSADPQSVPVKVHDAILETACEIVLSGGNTPMQLLALQRLADFSARAEYREHKFQMDLWRKAHSAEMKQHRKSIDEQYLALARQSAQLPNARRKDLS